MGKYGVTELRTDEMMDISGGAIISSAMGYRFGVDVDVIGLGLTYLVNILPDMVSSFIRDFLKGASSD